MKANLSSPDRIARIIIAIVFITLYFTGVIPGIVGIILVIMSGVFVATSFISYCPIYGIFGWSSKKRRAA